MYKMNGRVRYSECGIDNKLRISAIINYFQDCTTENSEQIGVGHDYLLAGGDCASSKCAGEYRSLNMGDWVQRCVRTKRFLHEDCRR